MTISGPFVKNGGGLLNDGFQRQQVSYRQSKPWTRPLPYHNWQNKWTPGNALAKSRVDSQYRETTSFFDANLKALAYDRFYKQCGERANVLLNAYEFNKTFLMISNRLSQLTKAVNATRKLRFREAISSFKNKDYPASRSNVNKARKAYDDRGMAGSWLEYTFGWVPVITDIYTGCQILSRDFPYEKIISSAKKNHFKNYFSSGYVDSFSGISSVRMQSQIRIKNPNLLLADQLGLLNPALVFWDAVPFSFVVDWFLPVNKFLTSFSNGAGIEFKNGFTTYKTFYEGSTLELAAVPPLSGSYHSRSFFRDDHMIARPSLFDRSKLPSPSLWLAATSLSLVVQQLKK